MDAKTTHNLTVVDSIVESTELNQKLRKLWSPKFIAWPAEKKKEYHEPKFLRNERKVIEKI